MENGWVTLHIFCITQTQHFIQNIDQRDLQDNLIFKNNTVVISIR